MVKEGSICARGMTSFNNFKRRMTNKSGTSTGECGDSPLYFDEGSIEDKYGDEDSDRRSIPISSPKIVGLVIPLSLWKCGNTDGERYDVEFCVERSWVKCRRTSFT